MPKYYKKKRVFRKKKKAPYRTSIPRTIQIATKRNANQTLKFVVNQTYVVDPTQLAVGKCAVLSYRANSIFHSHMPTGSNAVQVFKSQDPGKYNNNGQLTPSVINQNADGWDDWTNRYQHFCVTGSKITYTFEPTGTGAPAIFFSHLAGVSSAIISDSTSAFINTLPYCHRHSVPSAPLFSIANMGIRGARTYSARKFEGVKDPEDNSNLRGRFANQYTQPANTGATPGEQSFFYLGLAPVDPNTQTKMTPGVLRVKIEYITQLKEPTESNKIQVSATGQAPSHEL